MLEVHRVSKSYEDKPLLKDISFQVNRGETVCLLGASGSGKSTLLRIIAGLEPADSGYVSFNGEDLTSIPAHLRDFGMVFQDYTLFPHLDVEGNVAFGLRMRRLPRHEIDERIVNALQLVNLSGFEERRVTDLSGGEQQRVALARALVTRPRLLMFDEPLGALDRTLREDLLNELRAILHRTDIPAIYVTHDQEEAFAIADRILILHNGEIIRHGTPADVWENPGSAYVAGFMGLGSLFSGKVRRELQKGKWEVESVLGSLVVHCVHQHQIGQQINLLARPLEDSVESLQHAINNIRGNVSDVFFQQGNYKVALDNGIQIEMHKPPRVGERVEVSIRVECLA